MRFPGLLKGIVPRSLRLPASYYFHKLAGRHEAELSVLGALVGSGKRALDVGANIGFYSLALSRLCEAVEAFEPVPDCADILCDFGAKNIRVHRVGLSSTSGTLPLRVPLVGGMPNFLSAGFRKGRGERETLIDVPVRRLDDFHFGEVSFLKIDVEGHELHVIEGGRETILRERPSMLIEIEQRHHSQPIDGVFRQVLDMGYAGGFYFRGEFRPLAEFDCRFHQRTDLADTMDGRYINNFVFRPYVR